MTLSLNGGVFAQALTHKISKSWKLRSWLLYDYKKPKKAAASVGAEQINDLTADWLDSLTLGDLVFDESKIVESNSVGAAALDGAESYEEINSAHINPCIAQISDTEYLLATVYNTGTRKNTIRCFIYNTATDAVTYAKNLTDAYQPAGNAEKAEFDKCTDLVDEVTLTDCGDKLFLCWNSIQYGSNEEITIADAFRNVRVSGIFFDKAERKFESFDAIDGDKNSYNYNLKTVYNPNTKVVSVFYETADASSLTNETKLTDLNGLEASTGGKAENESQRTIGKNKALFLPERVYQRIHRTAVGKEMEASFVHFPVLCSPACFVPCYSLLELRSTTYKRCCHFLRKQIDRLIFDVTAVHHKCIRF